VIDNVIFITEHTFNLTSLASSSAYEVQTKDGRTFHLNICNSVADSNCPTNTGKFRLFVFILT